MPWTEQSLPWNQSDSPLASQASYAGTQGPDQSTQTIRLLEAYAKYGPMDDREASERLGLERNMINARRRPLCQRGIVVAVDLRTNSTTGKLNTRWGLARP